MAKKNNFFDGLKKHWDKLMRSGQVCQCVTCVKHGAMKQKYMANWTDSTDDPKDDEEE